jgi:hypothetical protein
MRKASKGNANSGYHSRKTSGGMDKPKLGGGMKMGDNRSKKYMGNIKPQKGC